MPTLSPGFNQPNGELRRDGWQ